MLCQSLGEATCAPREVIKRDLLSWLKVWLYKGFRTPCKRSIRGIGFKELKTNRAVPSGL